MFSTLIACLPDKLSISGRFKRSPQSSEETPLVRCAALPAVQSPAQVPQLSSDQLLHHTEIECSPHQPGYWKYPENKLSDFITKFSPTIPASYRPEELISYLENNSVSFYNLIIEYSSTIMPRKINPAQKGAANFLPQRQHHTKFQAVTLLIQADIQTSGGIEIPLPSEVAKQYILYAAKNAISRIKCKSNINFIEFAALARFSPAAREECLIAAAVQIIYDAVAAPLMESKLWPSLIYVNGLSVNIISNLLALTLIAFLDERPQLKLFNNQVITASQIFIAGFRSFYPLLSNSLTAFIYSKWKQYKWGECKTYDKEKDRTNIQKSIIRAFPKERLAEIEGLSEMLEISVSTILQVLINLVIIYLEYTSVYYKAPALSSTLLNSVVTFILARLVRTLYRHIKNYGFSPRHANNNLTSV